MTGMARRFASTAVTALALCGVPATAHARRWSREPASDRRRAHRSGSSRSRADRQAGTGVQWATRRRVVLRRGFGQRRPVGGGRRQASLGRERAAVMLQDQNSYMSFAKADLPGAT
jgi:hypothetical protein